MKFSYIAPLAALRGTGQPLGGLTVDIGMFSEHFLLWKVWKAILSSNIRHLRLFFFFFFKGFYTLQPPRFLDHLGMRLMKTHVHSNLK